MKRNERKINGSKENKYVSNQIGRYSNLVKLSDDCVMGVSSNETYIINPKLLLDSVKPATSATGIHGITKSKTTTTQQGEVWVLNS